MTRHRSWAEPWKIKVVEPIHMTSAADRERHMRDAGYNTFLLRSEEVYIDLLTDSGTNAMSDRQWAGMMMGDEAYAGSRNYYALEDAVRQYYGFPHLIPTHQGRGAEHLLSRILITPGDHVPGNMYFTTTRVHQELAGATFHDVIIDEAHDPTSEHPFKGDVDLDKLDALVREVGAERVPYISVAATVNLAGGQPLQLSNLRRVADYCRARSIRVILDATRAVENAWFIQQREPGMHHHPVAAILKLMCECADGATMSGKKDSLVNIGGWLGLREESLAQEARGLVVVYEGLHTYGGLAGRDMQAMAIGIAESVEEDHIRSRIGQVHYLGQRLIEAGVPVVRPLGGHAVFLDAAAILPELPREQFPAQALAAALYLESGVRAMERGAVSAGRDPNTGENRYPSLELVRLTIPRRVYTQAHMDVVVESVEEVFDQRAQVQGLRFTYEPELLRFFQARFEPMTTPAEDLDAARAVGRDRLPSPVRSLLCHAGEHAQRHTSQLITTAETRRGATAGYSPESSASSDRRPWQRTLRTGGQMAFDVRLAERVRRALAPRRDVEEKRMFGGIAFMVQGHMACGIVGSSLMVRLDHEMAAASLRRRHVRPMDFTGKPMRGFLYVDAPGIATTAKLRDWVRRATAHAESLPVKGATPTPTRSAARTGTGGRARTPVVSTRRPTGEALRATIKRRGAD